MTLFYRRGVIAIATLSPKDDSMGPKETEPQAKRLTAFERFTAALLHVPKAESDDALDAKRTTHKQVEADKRANNAR